MQYGAPISCFSFCIRNRVGLRINAYFECVVLEFALSALITNAALKRVIDIIHFHNCAALFENLLVGYRNLHPLFDFCVTRIDTLAICFNKADPASKRR